ncbi:hypothetical protein DRJ12_03015 [Candidatus Acetothermia bacterium]|nr:MAG: hypothetical protein DRJ12_03015 [Candidatus Acetothermia bacterium]
MGKMKKGESSVKRGIIIAIFLIGVGIILGGCSLFQKGPALTNWEPVMSPDGMKIAFESPGDKGFEIYLRDVSSGQVEQLTKNEVDDWSPSWSPDGTAIVFISNRDKNVDLYVMDLATKNVTRLTTNEKDDVNPQWGVDGRILFNSNRTGAWEIYSINPDGTDLKQLTQTATTK